MGPCFILRSARARPRLGLGTMHDIIDNVKSEKLWNFKMVNLSILMFTWQEQHSPINLMYEVELISYRLRQTKQRPNKCRGSGAKLRPSHLDEFQFRIQPNLYLHIQYVPNASARTYKSTRVCNMVALRSSWARGPVRSRSNMSGPVPLSHVLSRLGILV